MAQPTGAPAMHQGLLAGFGAFMPNADLQVFVPIVCAQTLPAATAGTDLRGSWCKPKGVRTVFVMCQGPGGGAGSGRKGSTITVCCGGGGGAGGGFSFGFFAAADLPDEVPVYVPAGGAGGAAISGSDASGNPGTTPTFAASAFGATGSSSFAPSPAALLVGGAGGQGSGGSAASGTGGSSPTGGFAATVASTTQFSGGSANTSGNVGVAGFSPAYGGGGGGSGGGLTSGNLHSAGGAGAMMTNNTSNAAGSIPSNAGAIASNGLPGTNGPLMLALRVGIGGTASSLALPGDRYIYPGGGGGGGGSANTGDAVSGGNGGNGFWGGGGGGGGAATDTSSPQSGAGGNGGDGFIVVMAW